MLRCSSLQLGAVRWQHALIPTARNFGANSPTRSAGHWNHKALTRIGFGGAFRTLHQITGQLIQGVDFRTVADQTCSLSPTGEAKAWTTERPSDIILPAIDALRLTLDAVGTSWTVLMELRNADALPNNFCKNSPTRRTNASRIEFFQMMNASRRPVKAGGVCSDSATSTSIPPKLIKARTPGGGLQRSPYECHRTDEVAPIDTHSTCRTCHQSQTRGIDRRMRPPIQRTHRQRHRHFQ